MIEVFKITHNIYDPKVSPELRYYLKSNTRGNKYKLLNHTFHYNTQKYSFTARIVNIWNSLHNSVADVDTVWLFKARLDKFWMHQDVLWFYGRPDWNRRQISTRIKLIVVLDIQKWIDICGHWGVLTPASIDARWVELIYSIWCIGYTGRTSLNVQQAHIGC